MTRYAADADEDIRNEPHHNWQPDWGPLERTPADGVVPRPGTEQVIATRRGAENNADIYLSAPIAWLNGARINGVNQVPFLTAYRLVGTARHLLRTFQLTGVPATDASNGVQLQTTNPNRINIQMLVARGFVCDGFEVTISLPAGTLDTPGSFGDPCVGKMFSWGRETALSAGDGKSSAIGPSADVTIVGPLPLPVLVSPNPLPVVDAPASAWTEISGRAVDNTALPFVALAAHAASRYVEISAASTNGGIVYVASAALGVGANASAAYELAAGDSVRIDIDNTSKVFVAGSDGLQDYRVAIV